MTTRYPAAWTWRSASLENLIWAAAVLCSTGAAAIHFAVIGEHFSESSLYGTFFAVVASLQVAWALAAARRPSARLYWAGAAGNAAVITLWAVTRTVGIPLGPAAGEIEPAGSADLLAALLESIVVVACLALAFRGEREGAREARTFLSPMPLVVALVVAFATTFALVDLASGAEAADGMEVPSDPAGAMNMGGDTPMPMETLTETTWEGMKISLASMPPARHTIFQGSQRLEIVPKPEDSLHLMVVLADEQTGEHIPYSSVRVTIRNAQGGVLFDERMAAVLSQSLGAYYGINVPLPAPGSYLVSVQVGPPEAARQPEYADRWLEPFTFETQLTWEG